MRKFLFCWLVLAVTILVNGAKATTTFPIATNPAVTEVAGGFATSGSNSIVSILAGTNVCYQLVSSNGTLIGSLVTIGKSLGFPYIAFGSTNYLSIWFDDFVSSPFGQIISSSGATVGSAFSLGSGVSKVSALTSDGTNFLAIWQDGSKNFYGQLVTSTGTLSGAAFLISSQLQNGSSAAATFGKTNYLVVWQSNNGSVGNVNQAFGEFVSGNGLAGSPFQISLTSSPDQTFLTVAFDGTNYLAVWPWHSGPATGGNVTNWQFNARLVSQIGTFPGSELALITNRNQIIPSLAFDGVNYLLAYGFDSNSTNSDRNLRCQFIDRSGNLVGPLFTPFAPSGTNTTLFALHSLFFSGTRFGMAASLGTLGVNGDVFGVFIPASTTPPTLTASNLVGTQFPLQLTGTPGINYAIQVRTNLVSGNWTDVVTNSPTNGTFSFDDTHATNASRFYRALKQ
ncbi:MAG TPA: hypothetical protein VIK35_05940 [Verrucomicrobiae bacterium]